MGPPLEVRLERSLRAAFSPEGMLRNTREGAPVRRGGVILAFFGTALFERLARRRLVRFYQKYLGNPLFRGSAGIVPGWALIETTGARTGLVHQVPVGGRLQGESFWLVAGDWRHAQYVRNIQANPRVRVRVHGRWRTGTAQPLPDDDVRRRLLRLNPLNGLFVWIANRDLVTIRVDFD